MSIKDRILLNSAVLLLALACIVGDYTLWALLSGLLGSIKSFFVALAVYGIFVPLVFRGSETR